MNMNQMMMNPMMMNQMNMNKMNRNNNNMNNNNMNNNNNNMDNNMNNYMNINNNINYNISNNRNNNNFMRNNNNINMNNIMNNNMNMNIDYMNNNMDNMNRNMDNNMNIYNMNNNMNINNSMNNNMNMNMINNMNNNMNNMNNNMDNMNMNMVYTMINNMDYDINNINNIMNNWNGGMDNMNRNNVNMNIIGGIDNINNLNNNNMNMNDNMNNIYNNFNNMNNKNNNFMNNFNNNHHMSINNNQNFNSPIINNNTQAQFQNLCNKFNYINAINNFNSIIKLELNILYYDETLKISFENNNNCSFFKANTKGTFYGCHYFQLFQYVCECIKYSRKEFILITSGSSAEKIFNYCQDIEEIKAYIIYCGDKNKYLSLKEKYHKLKGVYDNFNEVIGLLINFPRMININIKSSNLFFLEDYNNKYIKLHYEIIKKYSIYKKLKTQHYNEIQFTNNKNNYYLDLAEQLLYHDEDEMIKYFKNFTDENEETIKQLFNGDHNINNYVSIYTNESFYYKYLNKFLREGDYEHFKILSNHISKFIYHLYDYRKKNYQNHDNSLLFRNMYISSEEFYNYQNSLDKIICYPSFTSTSLNENFKPVEQYNELFVKIIIEQNNSKSVVSIGELSINPEEKEYLFLPFSFFKIKIVKEVKGTLENPHIIHLIALNSDIPIEDIIINFMENETDNLDPEGLNLLVLNELETKLSINQKLLFNNYIEGNNN